jgi:hypothetical protein
MTTSSVTNGRGSTKRTQRFLGRLAIFCVSLVITLIWSTQFIVSLPLALLAQGIKRSWPIIDYPMYNEPHFVGDKIPRMAVVGVLENAQEIDIGPEDIGGGYWYYQVFAKAMRRGDEDVIWDMARAYEARHNIRLAALRVENRPLVWNSTKVAAAPTEILRAYPLTGPHTFDLP